MVHEFEIMIAKNDWELFFTKISLFDITHIQSHLRN